MWGGWACFWAAPGDLVCSRSQSMSQKPGDRSWEPQRLMEGPRRAEAGVGTWVCSGGASRLAGLLALSGSPNAEVASSCGWGKGRLGVLEPVDLQP